VAERISDPPDPGAAAAGVGPMRGRFIVFEGGEASGKSTQAAVFADRLGALLTREPGGTEVGRALRSLVLDPAAGTLDPRAEALLMLADRAQHVAEVVAPALARVRPWRTRATRVASTWPTSPGCQRGRVAEWSPIWSSCST